MLNGIYYKTFYEEYMKFLKTMLLQAILQLNLVKFGSHIRPQPYGLRLKLKMMELSTEQRIISWSWTEGRPIVAIEWHPNNRSRGASSQWPVSEDDMFPFLLRFIILFFTAEYRTSTVFFSSNVMWVSQQMYILLTISAEENPPPGLPDSPGLGFYLS